MCVCVCGGGDLCTRINVMSKEGEDEPFAPHLKETLNCLQPKIT